MSKRGRPRKLAQGGAAVILPWLLAILDGVSPCTALSRKPFRTRGPTTIDGKGKRGRPRSRAADARKIADRLVILDCAGMNGRIARKQVAREFSLGEDYIRRQIDWWDRHCHDYYCDPDIAHDEHILEQAEKEHETALSDAAD